MSARPAFHKIDFCAAKFILENYVLSKLQKEWAYDYLS